MPNTTLNFLASGKRVAYRWNSRLPVSRLGAMITFAPPMKVFSCPLRYMAADRRDSATLTLTSPSIRIEL